MFTILQVRCHCFSKTGFSRWSWLIKSFSFGLVHEQNQHSRFLSDARDSHVRTVNCLRTDVKTATDFRNDITHPWDLRCISSLFKPSQCFSSHSDCDDSHPLVCDLKDYISLLMGSSTQLTPLPFYIYQHKKWVCLPCSHLPLFPPLMKAKCVLAF